jgi:hypothetical protein
MKKQQEVNKVVLRLLVDALGQPVVTVDVDNDIALDVIAASLAKAAAALLGEIEDSEGIQPTVSH